MNSKNEKQVELIKKHLGLKYYFSTGPIHTSIFDAMTEYARWYNSQDSNTELKYTKQDVIDIIDAILQHPDQVIDAVSVENSDWSADELLKLSLFENPNING